MKQKKFIGKLIAVDMYNCNIDIISDAKKVEELVIAGCEEFSLHNQQTIMCNEEEQHEYSLSAICQHGHITLHVYPEMGFISVDVFSCHEDAKPGAMGRYLRNVFDADKCKITIVDRGDFGNKNDMKPSHRSQVKFVRRTKNATTNMGNKLKNILMKARGK